MIELLACAGACSILMYGKPTEPVRILAGFFGIESLFKCALCLGVWVSLAYAYFFSQDLITFPLAGAAFCWLFDCVIKSLQEVFA